MIGIDFETYYDAEYSLGKMPTEEYVRDPRFEIIGCAVKHDGAPAQWVHPRDLQDYLRRLDIDRQIVYAHNARFDAMILDRHFGIIPARLVCTMSLARAHGLARLGSVSLGALAKRMRAAGYGVPLKGDMAVQNKGRRLVDFTDADWRSYGDYAANDIEISYKLLEYFIPLLTDTELAWQSAMLKGFVMRGICIDGDTITTELRRIAHARSTLEQRLVTILGCSPDDVFKRLRSKTSLLQALHSLGGAIAPQESGCQNSEEYAAYLLARPCGSDRIAFTIPMKTSAAKSRTAGKTVYDLAVAKTDAAWLELGDNGLPDVQELVSGRLGAASSAPHRRAERFLSLAKFSDGIGAPLNISAAHTHRLGGADKINIQNLPSGRKNTSRALRDSIKPVAGHVFVAADASQIEARLLAYAAQQTDLLRTFATGGDPYSEMASYIFGKPAADVRAGYKAGDAECVFMRQCGKATILGAGYGMGWNKFFTVAATVYNVSLSMEQARHGIATYRSRMVMVPRFWRTCDVVLEALATGKSGVFGGPGNCLFEYTVRDVLGEQVPSIRAAGGLWLSYPGLRLTGTGDYAYSTRYGTTSIHGGKLTENLIQYLAFHIGKLQIRSFMRRYPVVLQEHDSYVGLVPEAEKDIGVDLIRQAMSYVPPVVAGCPLACEAGWGRSFGEIEKR